MGRSVMLRGFCALALASISSPHAAARSEEHSIRVLHRIFYRLVDGKSHFLFWV
jgi:hypothetical protein